MLNMLNLLLRIKFKEQMFKIQCVSQQLKNDINKLVSLGFESARKKESMHFR
jgi:hypothetical protein